MSWKDLVLYSLLLFLCLLWWRGQPQVESLNTSGTTELHFVKEKAVHVQPPVQTQVTNTSVAPTCRFPIRYDLSGKPFQINYRASFDTGRLQSELEQGIDTLLSTYESWLPGQRLAGIKLNVQVMLPDEFNDAMRGRVSDPNKVLGVYFSRENLAVIKFVDSEQALATGIHEAVHGINYSLFGRLPRFINEGLAEYAERLTTVAPMSFALPKGWSKQEAKDQILGFYALMHSEQDWHSTNSDSLYLSGNAWASFLLSTELGLAAVQKVLAHKQSLPCSELTSDDIIAMITDVYPNFEQDFGYWFGEYTSE